MAIYMVTTTNTRRMLDDQRDEDCDFPDDSFDNVQLFTSRRAALASAKSSAKGSNVAFNVIELKALRTFKAGW